MVVENNFYSRSFSDSNYNPLNLENPLDALLLEILDLQNNGNYSEAESQLNKLFSKTLFVENLDSFRWQYIASIAMALGKLDLAKASYIRSGNLPGAAYASIINREIDEARLILSNTTLSSPVAWCIFLIELLDDKGIKHYPTFLQIRHFMEMTVYYSLVAKNERLVKWLKASASKLMEINIDALKLIGYAYFNYGLKDEALDILSTAAQENKFDGEIYYFLGQIYFDKQDYNNSMSMIENAKTCMPNHYPTKVLKDKLDSLHL